MKRLFLVSISTLAILTGGLSKSAQALPSLVGVSSSTTIQSFEGTSSTESILRGEFSELGVTLTTAGSAGVVFDLDRRQTQLSGDGSAGAVAGINIFEYSGTYRENGSTTAEFTGQTLTSQTNFN